MPAELFRTVAARRRSPRRLSAVPLSVAFHAALLVAIVTIPLVATTDELPPPHWPGGVEFDMTPAIVIPKPPPAPSPHRALPGPPTPVVPLVAPTGIRENPLAVPDEGIPQLRPDAVVGGLDNLTQLQIEPPPPSPVPAKVEKPAYYKPGGEIAMPRKIHTVPPVYPPMAIAARVQGTVEIEAIISATGVVQNARVVHSVALLDDAALDAVRQWVFTPTRLNGEPVAVMLTVKVEFKLQ